MGHPVVVAKSSVSGGLVTTMWNEVREYILMLKFVCDLGWGRNRNFFKWQSLLLVKKIESDKFGTNKEQFSSSINFFLIKLDTNITFLKKKLKGQNWY